MDEIQKNLLVYQAYILILTVVIGDARMSIKYTRDEFNVYVGREDEAHVCVLYYRNARVCA